MAVLGVRRNGQRMNVSANNSNNNVSTSSDTFARDTSEDWFDSQDRRQAANSDGRVVKCADCGLDAAKAKFCPQTGRPHPVISNTATVTDGAARSHAPTSTSDLAKILAAIPLFSGVSGSRKPFMDSLTETVQMKNYFSGQEIFRAGDEGSSMFIVLSGRVQLVTRSHAHLSYLDKGKQFGEIAMLYGGTRNATAIAEQQCTLGVLSRSSLESCIRRHNCHDEVMKNAQHIPYVKQWFISNVPLFQTCSHNSAFIDRIADALQYKMVPQGTDIIRKGEVGTEMYFLVSGKCDVIDNRRKVSTVPEGKYFGEVAMLFGTERTATVTSSMDSYLYVLTKAMFDGALDRYTDCIDAIYGTAQETRYLKEHFIKRLPLFQALKNNQEFVMNMGDALHSRTFLKGEYIVRQNSSGTSMYFVARGDVDIEKDSAVVAQLSSGDFFGELSLLYDEPRSASIKAKTHVHTYELQQDAFEVIAIAFPDWWESITKDGGTIFGRIDRSRSSTNTQHHGLVIPEMNRGTPLNRGVSHTTQVIMNAEGGSQADRDALRRQLMQQGSRPQERTATERLRELEEERLCIACMDAPKCMLMVPCGHICCCEACSANIRTCPQCRAAVSLQYKAHV